MSDGWLFDKQYSTSTYGNFFGSQIFFRIFYKAKEPLIDVKISLTGVKRCLYKKKKIYYWSIESDIISYMPKIDDHIYSN